MEPVLGSELGKRLLKVLGLEGQHVTRIEIDCGVDDAVICTVEKFITDDEAERIVEIITDYELVKKVESEIDSAQLVGIGRGFCNLMRRISGGEEQ